MIYTETKLNKRARKTLFLIHEDQNGRFCFLNSVSERSLSVAGSKLSPRFGQQFMFKIYNAKFVIINID